MARDESIAAGNVALEEGRWLDARTAFEAALEEGETAETSVGLGQALWWLGDARRSVEYHERAYAQFRRAGNPERAAWAGLWLSMTYGSHFGNHAASSGWIARAQRVLEDVASSPLLGWLWLVQSYDTTTDLRHGRELTERVLAMARSSGDFDLELCALARLGEVLVTMAKIEEGLALIDEAMAGTFGGERDWFVTVVFTSCSMIVACDLAADIERATQWCQVADRFIREYGCPFLYAKCRTAYGGMLVEAGHWTDAERELTAAIGMTQDAYPAMYAAALARLADLRLSQGRLEEAEELLSGVEDEASCALPMAKARLARREPAVAIALLQRRLDALGGHCVEMTSILALLVEAHLAQADLEAAAAAAKRMKSLALQQNGDLIAARAARTCARVLMAQGDSGAAIGELEEALRRFSQLRLPLETARTRLALGRILADWQPEVAVAEGRQALANFDQVGAAADADAAASFLRSQGVAGRTGPKDVGLLTQREQEVLRLIGLGLSNPEIGQRLVISRKTASHHVSSVLAKLGLRNRAEAVAYATRTFGEPSGR